MNLRLLEHGVAVNRQADGEEFIVLPSNLVLADDFLGGPAAVLGGRGGGEVPFHVRGAGDERDVVEVDDLVDLSIFLVFGKRTLGGKTCRRSSNFG